VGDEDVPVRHAPGPAGRLEVGANALLAAGDLQQLAVKLDVPESVETEFREGPIEGDALTVSLGIHQHAVAIENERLHADVVLRRLSTARRRRDWHRRTARSST